MLKDVFHFSFTVSDVEQSVRWYRDVLGLELVHRQRQENDYTRTLVGMRDAVLEVAQFKIRDVSPSLSTHMLELVEYVTPKGGRPELQTNQIGSAHICFVVPDITEEYERLLSRGVRFCNPPVEIAAGVNRGGRACYFSDPDGITLELHEPPPHRKQALGLDNANATTFEMTRRTNS